MDVLTNDPAPIEPQPPLPEKGTARWADLQRRTLSAIVMLALASAAIISIWLFLLFSAVIFGLLIHEWRGLNPIRSKRWHVLGLAYILPAIASLIWLYLLDLGGGSGDGPKVIGFIVAVISATDIGAFFTGRTLGGPRLAPAISPKKTLSGFFGGVICAIIVGLLLHSFTPYPVTELSTIGICIILSVFTQIGDLLESWLKRRAGVKDSSNLIPGHGGLLDRLDGYMLAVPAMLVIMLYFS